MIDGDIIRYRCAFAAEKTHYLVETRHEDNSPALDIDYTEFQTAKEAKEFAEERDGIVWSRKEVQPVEFALQATKTTMEALLARYPDSELRLYLSGPSNFRDRIALSKRYKDNRPPKPRWYKDVGAYLVEQWGAKYTDGCEADDVIADDSKSLGDRGIIVSTDKDLNQIPGRHFNWTTGEEYGVSKRDSSFNLWRQVLTGDPTDNVPGLDGVGPARADIILDGAKSSMELEERVRIAYRDHGKSDEYFLEQVRLIRLGRPDAE